MVSAPAPMQPSPRRRVWGHGRPHHDRRQRGGCLGRLPRQRGDRDLSDHARVADGRALRRVVGCGHPERLGRGAAGDRDAERGRRGGRRPRRPPGRGARDDVHVVAGPAPDAAEHVQDRRRADAGRDPRRRARDRHPRALDLRRPLRRDGRPVDGLRAALLVVGAGGAGPRPRRARGDPRGARAVPPLLRRLPHLARAQHVERLDEDDLRALLDEERVDGPPRSRAVARPPGAAGHGAEPRRLLPGPRGGQPVLRRAAGHRAAAHGRARRAHRAPLPALRLRGRSRRRARDRADGLRQHRRRRGGRGARRPGREGRRAHRAALPPVRRRRLRRGAPGDASRSVAVLDRSKEPGALGEPLFQDVVTALAERGGTMPHVVGGRYGLSSKEFTPAMAAAVLAELASRSRRRHFTVGIVDDVSRLSLPVDDSFRRRPTTSSARSSTASARTARSARTRTRSRSSASRRRSTPRATSSTTRRSPARSPSRTSASARARSPPRTWSGAPGSSPATSSGCWRRSTCSTWRAEGATFLLNRPTAPTRSGSTCPHGCRSRSSRSGSASTSSTRRRSRARRGWEARQHRAPDLLLRARRRAAARRGDRRDQGGDPGELRASAARSCSSGTTRRSTGPRRAPRGARPGRRSTGSAGRAPAAADAPDFVARTTAMMIAGKGDTPPRQRAAGRRHVPGRHRALREALDRGRDPDLGSRRSASTAPSARSSARMRRSG